MRLLVDIGNTRSKFALEENGDVQSAFVLDHENLSAESLRSHCSETLLPESVWISCVGPDAVLSTIEGWVASQFSLPVNLVSVSEEQCGVTNGYHDKSRLGVDRWVAAIGAHTMAADTDVIIIDAGTAVTIDWVSRNGVFEGGVILPGYELMHRSLVGNTERIESELILSDRIIGKTTTECVNSGLSFGMAGAVERIVDEMQKHLSLDSLIILTGGSAEPLSAKMRIECTPEPRLVLLGLASIAGSAA